MGQLPADQARYAWDASRLARGGCHVEPAVWRLPNTVLLVFFTFSFSFLTNTLLIFSLVRLGFIARRWKSLYVDSGVESG